ncbi:alkaline phosphatase [Macrococcus armenti]|uniref:alkaline phosphatase n=1 Tax=Macrococcus armenti TaxID=2875764 RepID=UPI001CCFA89A|nr:alkaline phosphatase [Macrococcus armenti]UBH09184.1 alkaline phosphatase [Macrococcus armenti]UBH11479.1 alkaline phosphatase [Macrococcus armenti]
MVSFKSIATTTLLSATILAGISASTDAAGKQHQGKALGHSKHAKIAQCKNGQPKNVILMIGDGMGISQLGAYRYYKDNENVPGLDKISFDNYLVGSQLTVSDDPKLNITDSGAAGTALATGVRTFNGAISVDKNKQAVRTVLEDYKAAGRSTGLVATSELTHATPAAFAAHNPSRKDEMDIAKQMARTVNVGKEEQPIVDVMLGGGTDFFQQKDKNGKVTLDLVKQMQDKSGFKYVTSRDEMLKDTNSKRMIGLFAESAMSKHIDRTEKEPSLKEMTDTAIQKLSQNKKGFFLMVEGSQPDWSGHANDLTGMISEISAFDEAYQSAIEYAKKDCNTLVIALADHATGGLSVGTGEKYEFHPKVVDQMKMTHEGLTAKLLEKDADIETLVNENIQIKDITAEEKKAIIDAAKATDEAKTLAAINKVVDKRANAAWGSKVHTGEEVHVYAFGPGKEKFMGVQHNVQNAENIRSFLK